MIQQLNNKLKYGRLFHFLSQNGKEKRGCAIFNKLKYGRLFHFLSQNGKEKRWCAIFKLKRKNSDLCVQAKATWTFYEYISQERLFQKQRDAASAKQQIEIWLTFSFSFSKWEREEMLSHFSNKEKNLCPLCKSKGYMWTFQFPKWRKRYKKFLLLLKS